MCDLCDKCSFVKKSQLKKHMLEKHDLGWFVCDDHCGKKFQSQKLLEMHVERVNENEKHKFDRIYF